MVCIVTYNVNILFEYMYNLLEISCKEENLTIDNEVIIVQCEQCVHQRTNTQCALLKGGL